MLRIERVERIPDALAAEVVYVSEEYEMAALRCPCGCGHRVLLLLGDGHTVSEINGWAEVSPSIGVWDAPCKSHFFVREGKVIWATPYSQAAIDHQMLQQLRRHEDATPVVRAWYVRLVRWIGSVLKGRRR